MASPLLRLFALAATAVSISLPLIPTALSQQTCKSQRFSGNNVYANCLDLPALSSFLHFTFDSANSTLSVAFLASPPASGGWVSWAINPSAPRMAGAQALVAYKDSKGVFAVKTYNISSYTSASVVQSKLDFEVWDARAEEQGSGGVVRIFAKLKLPADMAAKGTVNHVWQVGPSVDGKGVLAPHAMGTANLNARGALDFKGGQSVAVAGGGNSGLKKKNIHGVLNAVSWGILLPVGAIIARYVRSFPSADPAWFYLHVGCQVSGYAIGVSGWATGLKLGSESKGIQFTGHRNIGIALFAIATLQMFALFLRPGKEHKLRIYWNVYHHGAGYAILVLGILNVFKGLDMLQPESKWRKGYVVVIAALGGIAVLLEVITWSVVLRRKSKQSTKPYDHGGYGNNVQRSRQQQPLNA